MNYRELEAARLPVLRPRPPPACGNADRPHRPDDQPGREDGAGRVPRTPRHRCGHFALPTGDIYIYIILRMYRCISLNTSYHTYISEVYARLRVCTGMYSIAYVCVRVCACWRWAVRYNTLKTVTTSPRYLLHVLIADLT